MEKPSRDFKGIWIPKEIWESENLSIMEKVLFVEIHSLDNERGCYASNRYFSEFFHVSERQIQTHIANLKVKGFITVTIQNRYERVMRAAGKHARVHGEPYRTIGKPRRRVNLPNPANVVQCGRKTYLTT